MFALYFLSVSEFVRNCYQKIDQVIAFTKENFIFVLITLIMSLSLLYVKYYNILKYFV